MLPKRSKLWMGQTLKAKSLEQHLVRYTILYTTCNLTTFYTLLGTTKYCSYFLKGQNCANVGCQFLHENGEDAEAYLKEEARLYQYVFASLFIASCLLIIINAFHTSLVNDMKRASILPSNRALQNTWPNLLEYLPLLLLHGTHHYFYSQRLLLLTIHNHYSTGPNQHQAPATPPTRTFTTQ